MTIYIVQADGKARPLDNYERTLDPISRMILLRRKVRRETTPTQYLCSIRDGHDPKILATIYRSQTLHASRDEIRARIALGGLTFVSRF
jgi:hypothetical protein